MPEISPDAVTDYHAHVYYDAATKDAAARLRAAGRQTGHAIAQAEDKPSPDISR
ncbi:MAG: hypothetical protein ACE5GS_12875 [Kiloniellaceae bacterium]